MLSLTPFLLAVEIGFVAVLAWRAARIGTGLPGGPVAMTAYLAWIAGYGVLTSVLGARGAFIHDDLMPLLPGLWLQLVTIAALALPVLASRALRNGLRQVVDVTPWAWLAGFHALRISAVGTAYRTATGDFPVHFELLVGVPDLLFGLSALLIARRAARGELGEHTFLIWNLIGALVIVPAAPILLQLGLPGPLQVFEGPPDARAVYTFPMSIAPMLGVPLFVLVNLGVAWRLVERRRVAAGA